MSNFNKKMGFFRGEAGQAPGCLSGIPRNLNQGEFSIRIRSEVDAPLGSDFHEAARGRGAVDSRVCCDDVFFFGCWVVFVKELDYT